MIARKKTRVQAQSECRSTEADRAALTVVAAVGRVVWTGRAPARGKAKTCRTISLSLLGSQFFKS